MALKLIASYSKRLGLPGYSSHQFSVSVEAELTGAENISGESARLYETLQRSVDEQLQQAGYLPDSPKESVTTGNNRHNGHWACSTKQRDLILKLVEENSIDRKVVDDHAIQMFGKGVRQLNKLEASGLIDELIRKYGDRDVPRTRNGNRYFRGSTAA